jgi:hypothetical protein
MDKKENKVNWREVWRELEQWVEKSPVRGWESQKRKIRELVEKQLEKK